MLRQTRVAHKAPVVMKQGKGMFTHQLKRLLQKNHLHRHTWDPIPEYPMRPLVYADRTVDHRTGAVQQSAVWDAQAQHVPDQQYQTMPVPQEYHDPYWWRERQARRIQCPIEWVKHREEKRNAWKYDFQDLSYAEKFTYSEEEVIAHAQKRRE